MELKDLQKQLIDIKAFLDTIQLGNKSKTAKMLGITNQDFSKLVDDGMYQIVLMARDKMIMGEFIASKGLIEDMNLFHSAMIERMKGENEADGKKED